MRYFIIGYKNCGKTTIGRKLASRLNMQFVDLDEVIEKKERKSVPEIYVEVGDDGFRQKEWAALKEIVQQDNIVVALGGGTPCHCDNMNLIEKYGDVIYIQLDNDTLVNRLRRATRDRPIVLNKTDEELHDYVKNIRNRCEHHYLRAKYYVDGRDITVERIVQVLQAKGN